MSRGSIDWYREDQERREMLASFEPASPEQYRRWNLEDRLAQIDAAEPLWRAGHSGHGWSGMLVRSLGGRTPDQARADAHARYAQ